jgi:predicted nucleotidyltransferase
LREALSAFEPQIAVAFVFGSVAQGTERSGSDLDLFVLGSAGYSVVTEQVRTVENRLGRQVQVLYFDPASTADRKALRKASIKAIARGPKLFVIGDEKRLSDFIGVA